MIRRALLFLATLILGFPAWAASDDFSATNSPLASPWAAVSGWGGMLSTGGHCSVVTHDVDSAMIYSTSTETSSEVQHTAAGYPGGGSSNAGPALLDPATGNGYTLDHNGGTMAIIKWTAAAYDADSGGTADTASASPVLRLEIEGNDLVGYADDVEVDRWTDTTYRTGLQPGVWGSNSSAEIDNWTDGASAGGPTTPLTLQNLGKGYGPQRSQQLGGLLQ